MKIGAEADAVAISDETIVNSSTPIDNIVPQEPKVVKTESLNIGNDYVINRIKDLNHRATRTVEENKELVDLLYEQFGKPENGVQNNAVLGDNQKSVNSNYTHMYDESKVSEEFINSVNPQIEKAIIEIRNGNSQHVPKEIVVTDLQPNAVQELSKITGIDISDYVCKIALNELEHIEKRHGINGKHDKSLADPKDIARIGHVINNFDTITWARDEKGNVIYSKKYNSRNNKATPVLLIAKKIDGTFCVSEVVPDSSKKLFGLHLQEYKKQMLVAKCRMLY